MNPKSLVVLGMHRSGTSALSGMLNLLGVRLGNSLIPADPEINAKGYWEHSLISNTNETILRKLGHSWLDERSLPDQWWKKPEIKIPRLELTEVLKNDLAGPDLWAVKDPRICRLLPLWIEIFQKIDCKPHFLIITRHPHDVALSLNKRDHIRPWKSSLLWLRYLLDAEYYSRGYPRVFLSYDELLINWKELLAPIARELSIKWPIAPEKVYSELTSFIDTNLRHHDQSGENPIHQDCCIKLAISAYLLLNQSINNFQNAHPTLLEKLDRAVEQHRDSLSQINEYLIYINKLQTLGRDNKILEQEIERIKSTVSWRITSPLRIAWNSYQKIKSKW